MGRERPEFLKKYNYKKADFKTPGHRVSHGKYILRIIAEPTYSSRSHFQRIEEREVIIK